MNAIQETIITQIGFSKTFLLSKYITPAVPRSLQLWSKLSAADRARKKGNKEIT